MESITQELNISVKFGIANCDISAEKNSPLYMYVYFYFLANPTVYILVTFFMNKSQKTSS